MELRAGLWILSVQRVSFPGGWSWFIPLVSWLVCLGDLPAVLSGFVFSFEGLEALLELFSHEDREETFTQHKGRIAKGWQFFFFL